MTFSLHEASLMDSSRLQRRTGLAREDSQFPDRVSTGKVKKSYKMTLRLVVVVVVTLLAFWVQYKITKKVALLHVQQSLEAQNEKPIFVSVANEESKDTDSQFGVAESDVKKKEDSVSNVLTDENEQTQESNAEKENHETKDTDSQFGVGESDVKKKEDSVSNVLIDENEQTQESNAGIEHHVNEGTRSGDAEPAVEKVKDVISSIFAKGIILGKDAVKKAIKSNQLMNEKVRGLDEKLHVSEKLLSGASLVTSALNGVAKVATDIGQKTKGKVLAAEEQQSKVEGRAGTHGTEDTRSHDAVFSVKKVKDVFSQTVSKGFILGEDALKKAKSFTQNNQFTSTTAAKVASVYQKIGLNEKISASKIVINDKMRGIGENLHVSEKLLSAASLVTSSLNGVAKAATEIGQKTKVEGCAGTRGTEDTRSHDAEFSVEKVKDVFSRTVSKGFILGEDALKKAKSFTQNNQFTSTTAAKVASAYQKIGLNEKISASKILIDEKMRGIGENLHVSEKLLSAASLVTSSLNGVAKAATETGQKTKVEGCAGTHGTEDTRSHDAEFSVEKVKDVFSRTVSKGFVLGEDAVKKAKSFIQNNQFTSTTAAKVASAYQKFGLNEKISASKIMINDKIRGIGENLHVSDKISTGASLITGALKGIAKRAGKIGQKSEEK